MENHFEEIGNEVHRGFVSTHENILDLSSQFGKNSLINKDKEIPSSLLFSHHVQIQSVHKFVDKFPNLFPKEKAEKPKPSSNSHLKPVFEPLPSQYS